MTRLDPPPRITDRALAQRLEAAEGRTNAAFVDARRAAHPTIGAAWTRLMGTYVMFDGVGSPLTQTFGLGLFDAVSDAGLEAIEAFLASRGADVFHEVSPLADGALLSLLPARGYRPVEYTSVLWRPVEGPGPAAPSEGPLVRMVEPGAADEWAEVSAAGWGETPELAAFMREFGAVAARSEGTHCFWAELDGAPVATGAMAIHEGVALLAGASTRPAYRGRGAQAALLRARLAFAAAAGCDLAMMGAAPGSTSQGNAERQGFRIAYTRCKWQRTATTRALPVPVAG